MVFAQQQIQLVAGGRGDGIRAGEDGVLERRDTGTGALPRHSGNRGSHGSGSIGRVLMEHRNDLLDSDGFMAVVPAIVVRDHGHGGVADLCFTSQLGFLQVGHADNIGTPTAIEIRFGAGGELRTFHTNVDAALFGDYAGGLRTVPDGIGNGAADWIAKRYMADDSIAEEGRRPMERTVNELIGDHKLSRLMLEFE